MWASVDDVRRRWMGSSWDFTDEQVQALLDDAEDAVRATVPSVDADVAANVIPLSVSPVWCAVSFFVCCVTRMGNVPRM